MYLFRNLSYLMWDNKLTQEKLSSFINVSRSTISHWLDGMQLEPQTPHLKKLSDYFKVSIDYLCFEDLTTISKKERLDNYNLIQKRLKQ